MRTVSTIAALALISSAGAALAQSAPPAADDDLAIRQLTTHGGPVEDDGGPRGCRGGPSASDNAGHPGPGDCRGGRRGGGSQLFISPAGEPFHAKPGDPYPVAVWFARANKAHDGKLTRAEFVADSAAFFAKLDANHDGVIDGFETQDYEQKIVPEILPQVGRLNATDAGYGPNAPGVGREAGTNRRRAGYQGAGGPPRGGKGPSYEGAAPYSLINEPEPISGADSEFNGRITLEEFRKAASERFDLLDKKHRGYLTLAELPKTPVQQMEQQIADERRKQKDHGTPDDGR